MKKKEESEGQRKTLSNRANNQYKHKEILIAWSKAVSADIWTINASAQPFSFRMIPILIL